MRFKDSFLCFWFFLVFATILGRMGRIGLPISFMGAFAAMGVMEHP